MFCPACGAEQLSGQFCRNCGHALPQLAHEQQDASEEVSDETYYKAILGPRHQTYYLRQFAQFDAKGRAGISWHWPAFLLGIFWFAYRRMAGNAFLYYVVVPIAYVFGVMVLMLLFAVVWEGNANTGLYVKWVLLIGLVLYAFLFVPLRANAIYYQHCKGLINAHKRWGKDVSARLTGLSMRGGTSVRGFAGTLFLVAMLGGTGYIALSGYQDFYHHEQVFHAYEDGVAATQAVVSYREKFQHFPGALSETGYKEQFSSSTKVVSINKTTGILTVTLAGIEEDKSLVFVPSQDESGEITWRCSSPDIPDGFLPNHCKREFH